MARRKLINLTFIMEQDFRAPFTVDGYTFHPQAGPDQNHPLQVITARQIMRDNRRHKQNAYVEYTGAQKQSVMFRGGRFGNPQYSVERKFLEDLLVAGSLLTAQNWHLYSRKDYPQYPTTSRSHLEYISKDGAECERDLRIVANRIQDAAWQTQFKNGFHLITLLNHANILNSESRFLSMMVIWEWLYPHLRNPQGATPQDESNNLLEIFYFVLNHFWPNQVDASLRQSNIFHVLRNQLAHSGKLPINRGYAQPWMTTIQWEETHPNKGIKDYLKFFDRLTQVIVLKTVGIDGEEALAVFNFPEQLQSFLSTGRI